MAQTEFNEKADEEGITRCKCVAEFRICPALNSWIISRDINIKVNDIEREREKISMFA